ncbi:MAG: ParA family protein [Anaerolineales bacterium]
MSRIIGILNYKGGTGKTTTVVNLGAGLALTGKRVLCIDLDAQGSLASYFGKRYSYSMTDLIIGEVLPDRCIIKARENLDFIPSDRTVLQAAGHIWRLNDDLAARRVLPERLYGLTGYDYIIVDYSPSVSLLSEGGLLYVQELIVPVAMNHLSVLGFQQVSKTLKEVGRTPEHRVRLSLIVPTFYYGRLRKDRAIIQVLKRYFPNIIADPIRTNVKLAEAPGRRKTIFEYAPRSYGAVDYAKLVEKVVSLEQEG